MQKFIAKFADLIQGVLSGADRLVFSWELFEGFSIGLA